MIGGISQETWHKILDIIKKHSNITDIFLYGSRAKGNFQQGSDIDLAIKGRDITSEQITQIGLDYEDLYLPWKLGLTLYETLSNHDLKDHIDRVGVSLYRRNDI